MRHNISPTKSAFTWHYFSPTRSVIFTRTPTSSIIRSAISQLHKRVKEFDWRDITSGCSFAATLSIAVNGKIGRGAVWNLRVTMQNHTDYTLHAVVMDKRPGGKDGVQRVRIGWSTNKNNAVCWTYLQRVVTTTLARIRAPSSTDFQVIQVGDRDGSACLGWMRDSWCRSCELVTGTFPIAMPKENQQLAQVCSRYVRGSKLQRNHSCFFRSIIM